MYVPILLKKSEHVKVIKVTLKEGTPPRISNETRINIKTTLHRGTRKCDRSNVVPLLIVNVKIGRIWPSGYLGLIVHSLNAEQLSTSVSPYYYITTAKRKSKLDTLR